jgi:Zn-dependent protease
VSADNAIYLATIWALPVIIAITFHEAAHGFVAHLLGDDTAWRLGRVSFNPLKLDRLKKGGANIFDIAAFYAEQSGRAIAPRRVDVALIVDVSAAGGQRVIA